MTLHGGSESEDEAVAHEGRFDANALPGCHRAPRAPRHVPYLPVGMSVRDFRGYTESRYRGTSLMRKRLLQEPVRPVHRVF